MSLWADDATPAGPAAASADADPEKTPAESNGAESNAAESNLAESQVAAELAEILPELDSPRYELRRRAAERLAQLAARAEFRQELSLAIERVLLVPETSYELRLQLTDVARQLPRVSVPPPDEVPQEEIDRLIEQLDAESHGLRLGSAARLQWLLASPRLACPIMLRLKTRLDSPDLSIERRQMLESLLDQARGTWLSADDGQWELPPVDDDEIAALVEVMAQPAPRNAPAGEWPPHARAERELLDLMARNDCLDRVRQQLESRAQQPLSDDAATERFDRLLEWLRPAMIAEFWQGGRHVGIQYLIVGVPNQPELAVRPSLFDRIDDRLAHCVSGNSLEYPKDYPVGVAFPHPKPEMEDAQFHLVNLPTPRRRLAYEYHRKRDQRVRLAELSERTMAALVEQKTPLDDRYLLMLRQLDPDAVSRHIPRYLAAVEDRPYPLDGRFNSGPASWHGALCHVLAEIGTHEAMPGLADVIRDRRLLPSTPQAPYEMAWIAALSIAARDPWAGAEEWLAGLVERTDNLINDDEPSPELGATAAAILLERNLAAPAAYGLEPMEEAYLRSLGVQGYRFASPDGRQKVLRWWADQRQRAAGL